MNRLPMSFLLRALGRLFTMSPADTQDRDADYLAQATDIYDLERRMREIDSGQRTLHAIGSYGLFMR